MCDVWLNKVTQLGTKPFAGGGGYFTTVINCCITYNACQEKQYIKPHKTVRICKEHKILVHMT